MGTHDEILDLAMALALLAFLCHEGSQPRGAVPREDNDEQDEEDETDEHIQPNHNVKSANNNTHTRTQRNKTNTTH